MKTYTMENYDELHTTLSTKFSKGDEILLQTILKRKDFITGKFIGIKTKDDDVMVFIQTDDKTAVYVFADEILAIQNDTKGLVIDNEGNVALGRSVINFFNGLIGLALAGAVYFGVLWLLQYLGY